MFSINLKKLREEKCLSQYDLAKKLNISQSAIGNWEAGKREPNFSTMQMLASYFNVSVDYLLGRTEEQSPQFVIPTNLKDVQFAFYEGLQDLTQEDLDAVADFVEFIRSKKEKEKKK